MESSTKVIQLVIYPTHLALNRKYLGQDEDGNDQYKYGKSHWFKYKGLTFIEAPLKW